MSSKIRPWAGVALVEAFVVGWRAETNQHVAAAQEHKPDRIVVTIPLAE